MSLERQMSRCQQVEHTQDRGQIESLSRRPEQREYELVRPIELCGDSPAERARL